MKIIPFLVLVLMLSSCASYRYSMRKKSIQYLDCVEFLYDKGLKEGNIDSFCSKALEK